MLRQVMLRLRSWLRGSQLLRGEVDEEIRNHLDLRVRDLVAAGMEPEDARREAERRFGDLETARERLYASARSSEERVRLANRLDALRQDTVEAWRRIRATPAFSLLSVATFALGIGLTTTMFALVDAIVLRPLPFPEPERLVALYSVAEDLSEFPYVSSTNWLDWREQSGSLAATGLYQTDRMSVATADENTRVDGAEAGGRFFETLRTPMLVGRPYSEQEADERAPVAVVSDRFWRRFMDADPDLGEIVIGGESRRVVGVLDGRYAFPEGTDVWVPATYRRMSGALRNNINWYAVARLGAGVTPQAARGDLDGIAANIREQAPEALYSWGVGVVPLHDLVVGDAHRALYLLMGAVLSVLLVACANLAGQAYARSLSNVESAAVRLALGATRGRVLQHQVVEHLLLGLFGGGVGLLLTAGAASWIRSTGLPLPRAGAIVVDWRVLTFALTVSLLAGVLAGLAPALRVAGSEPRAAMGSVRGASARARAGTASVLVGVEVALSVVLLIGGGLLVRSFAAVAGRDLGYEPAGILTAQIELDGPGYELRGVDYDNRDHRLAFWDRTLQAAQGLPGNPRVALAREVPGTDLSGISQIRLADDPERELLATYRVVSEGWFATLGLPILAGRDFAASDDADAGRVAIVSRTFVESRWPEGDALGASFRAVSMERPMGAPDLTVIGVVEDLDSGYGVEELPAMYVSHRQVPHWTTQLTLAVRAERLDPGQLIGPLRERLRAIDPSIAADFDTVSGHLSRLLARDRLVMSILNGFALLALALAAIGVHGLLSFAVARRTREIAVRSALGADRARIMRLVIGSALRIAMAGAASGVLAAWWLSGYLEGLLDGVEPRDPVTFAAVLMTLLGVTLIAAWLPAWRAMRLDPSTALRSD